MLAVAHHPVTYQLERLGDIWGEILALSLRIDPAYDLHEPSFRALDAAGALRIWTARRGHLIGESMWVIALDPFHQRITQAQQVSLAVAPEARMSTVALHLVRMATRELELAGIPRQIASGPPSMRSLMARFGFTSPHITFLKEA